MEQFKILNLSKYYLYDKYELEDEIKNYKGILNNSMFEYLNSLLELEFSAIEDKISDTDRTALAELKIYKKIAIYNIYNRAISMFNQSDLDIKTDASLNVYAQLDEDKKIPLFKFEYGFDSFDYDEKMWVGDIHLYKSIEGKEKRKEELERIAEILKKLYKEKNPYHWYGPQFSSPSYRWEIDQMEKIKEYESTYKILEDKKELTEAEEKEIEITDKFHKMLLNDFGLLESDFEEEITNDNDKNSYLNKTLIKRMSNTHIHNNIKYI